MLIVTYFQVKLVGILIRRGRAYFLIIPHHLISRKVIREMKSLSTRDLNLTEIQESESENAGLLVRNGKDLKYPVFIHDYDNTIAFSFDFLAQQKAHFMGKFGSSRCINIYTTISLEPAHRNTRAYAHAFNFKTLMNAQESNRPRRLN